MSSTNHGWTSQEVEWSCEREEQVSSTDHGWILQEEEWSCEREE